MESENAAFVRRFNQAANDGDMETVRKRYHRDVVLVAYPSGSPDAGTFVGKKEVLRWFGDWFGGLFEDWRTDILELSEPAEGVVAVRSRSSGRGRASGVMLVGENLYNGYEIKDGLITRISVAGTHEEAMAGIGRSDLAGTVDRPPPNEGASK